MCIDVLVCFTSAIPLWLCSYTQPYTTNHLYMYSMHIQFKEIDSSSYFSHVHVCATHTSTRTQHTHTAVSVHVCLASRWLHRTLAENHLPPSLPPSPSLPLPPSLSLSLPLSLYLLANTIRPSSQIQSDHQLRHVIPHTSYNYMCVRGCMCNIQCAWIIYRYVCVLRHACRVGWTGR